MKSVLRFMSIRSPSSISQKQCPDIFKRGDKNRPFREIQGHQIPIFALKMIDRLVDRSWRIPEQIVNVSDSNQAEIV